VTRGEELLPSGWLVAGDAASEEAGRPAGALPYEISTTSTWSEGTEPMDAFANATRSGRKWDARKCRTRFNRMGS
jgi:hypothetical protein